MCEISKNLKFWHLEGNPSPVNPLCFRVHMFLVSDTRLYTLPCWSVRPSVRHISKFMRFSHYCSCPTVRDWIAVYPALFSIPFLSVFLVMVENAFVPIERYLREHIFKNFNCPMREWVSPWMERASKASVARQSTVKQVSGMSGASERSSEWATKWPDKNVIVSYEKRPLGSCYLLPCYPISDLFVWWQ